MFTNTGLLIDNRNLDRIQESLIRRSQRVQVGLRHKASLAIATSVEI